MDKLIVNYLGEWVYRDSHNYNTRYVLSYDGWIKDQGQDLALRFFKANNLDDVEKLAEAYIRFFHKHKLKPEQALVLFAPENRIKQWQAVLEQKFFILFNHVLENNPKIPIPYWVNYILNKKQTDIFAYKIAQIIINKSIQLSYQIVESNVSDQQALTVSHKNHWLKLEELGQGFVPGNFQKRNNKTSNTKPNNHIHLWWFDDLNLTNQDYYLQSKNWLNKIKDYNVIILTPNPYWVNLFQNCYSEQQQPTIIGLQSDYTHDFYMILFNKANYIDSRELLGQWLLKQNVKKQSKKANQKWNARHLFYHYKKNNQNKQPVYVEDDKMLYPAQSQKDEPTSAIPEELYGPVCRAFDNFKKTMGSVDQLVLNQIGQTAYNNLSPEQIDAVALSYYNFLRGNGLIIADETGTGKGRILAATIIALLNNKVNVVFFTEKTNLFSDLYRDFNNLGYVPDMFLFHDKANIFDESGQQIKKAKITQNYNQYHQPLILTTYSQFNRYKKQNPKLDWLIQHLKGQTSQLLTEEIKENVGHSDNKTYNRGCLILDESHNASGSSNINKNMEQLKNGASGILYSSATFVKTEKNLSIYRKALPVDNEQFRIIQKTLANDNLNDLRQTVTLAMAEQGSFLRRQHLVNKLPQQNTIELTTQHHQTIERLNNIWDCIFKLFNFKQKYLKNNGIKQTIESHWYKLGSTVNRISSELALFINIESLKPTIDDLLPETKPVLVLETTMEATLKRLLSDNEEQTFQLPIHYQTKNSNNNNQLLPLWKNKLRQLVQDIATDDMFVHSKQQKLLYGYLDHLCDNIEQLPDWPASPIDLIKQCLSDYSCDELSGRNIELIRDQNNNQDNIIAQERKPDSRNKTVYDFNHGQTDILIMTRTGSTGLSLHAGQNFSDQRPRCLIELEIPRDPVVRMQFWGRVSRKDEVVESHIISLVLNMPLIQRNWERQNKKYRIAISHLGYKSDWDDLPYLSKQGNIIAYEWLLKNPSIAGQLGIMSVPFSPDDTEIIDKLLTRSILLKLEKQKELVAFLDEGLEKMKNFDNSFKLEMNNQSENRYETFLYARPQPEKQIKKSANSKSSSSYDSKHNLNHDLNQLDVKLVQRIFRVKNTQKKSEDVISDIKNIDWPYNNIKKCYEHFKNKKGKGYQWAAWLLKNIKKGSMIKTQRPIDWQWTTAVVGNVLIPENSLQDNQTNQELYYGLTTIALQLWMPGMVDSVQVPLWCLFQQKSELLPQAVFNKQWYDSMSQVDHIMFHTLEGNPFLAALWSKKRNIGTNANINDMIEGYKNVIVLPRSMGYQDLMNSPIDLIDSKQCASFMKENDNPVLLETYYQEKIMVMPLKDDKSNATTKNGLFIHNNLFNSFNDKVLTFQLKKNLKKPVPNNHGYMVYSFDKNLLQYVINALNNLNYHFSIPSEFRQWYESKYKK